MKKAIQNLLFIITLLVITVTTLLAQPTIGTTTFDGTIDNFDVICNTSNPCSFPLQNTVDGWTFATNATGTFAGITENRTAPNSNVTVYSQNTTLISFKSSDGSEFKLENFRVQDVINISGAINPTIYTITAYKDNSMVGSISSTSVGTPTSLYYHKTLSSNPVFDNIDEIRLTGFGTSSVTFQVDEIRISAAAPSNTAPTASSFTASSGPFEDLTYTFATADFGYSDGDGDPLNNILIEAIPSAGTLYVDADNDNTFDSGEQLFVSSQVSKANLDAGNLQYVQNGSSSTSFQFEVNDGTENSTGNYIATLNVAPVPSVSLAVSPSSRNEGVATASVVSATLGNTYGANVTVNLLFSGTATGSGTDYTTSASSITITSGNTTGSINITNVPDALYEGSETVVVDINSVSNGTENGTQQVTYTITDDDPLPTASLEILDEYNPITDESGGQAYVRGKLSEQAGVTVSIPLSFNGTAIAGTDYAITGSIDIPAGQMMDSIRITSLFDGVEEGDETVVIDMATPTNATEDGTQQVILTIQDEDAVAPAGYSVVIDQSPIIASNDNVVSFTFAGAEVGASYNYSFTSSGGAGSVTNTGTIATATDQITGIDLSGLPDGTITLSVTLEDGFGNTGGAVTDTESKDATAPTGYIVSIDQSPINSANDNAVSFTFAGAEVGASYNYTFSSSGGGTNVTGNGTIGTATDQITGIDLSGLGEGTITLSATLTDIFGNTGGAVTDTETKDATAPTGYVVTIDQSPINSVNDNTTSFTFAGAEVDATYNYTFTSSGGAGSVTNSGTITTATDQITGIDLSGLPDGTITLSVTLRDVNNNLGGAVTDTETKETVAPTGYSVTIDQSPIIASNDNVVSFTFAGAEVGATYNYTFTSSGGAGSESNSGTITTATDQITGIDLSGLPDGTITLSVTLTDTNGNLGGAVTDTENKDTTAPSGYSVTIDQNSINASNNNAVSFTFAAAEVGATYNYTFSSSGGGTNVTGNGTIGTATDQITGIDLSGLGDGTITLSVILTDVNNNIGSTVTATSTKDVGVPSGYSVSIDRLGESIINSINESIIEFSASGLETSTTLNYSFTSDGGGTPVAGTETVSTSTEQFDNSGAGYDLSGLNDGTITLTISLTDPAGNTGTDATDTQTKDAGPPTGYSVAWDETFFNASTATSASFTVTNAEIGTTINNSVSSTGDGNTATVSNPTVVTNSTQVVTIDVSSLTDGILTVEVSLTDAGGNTGGTVSDNSVTLDQTLPSGYSVSIDQGSISTANQSATSFTFGGAEPGATYNYTFSSDGGGTNVTGSGIIATTTDQISGIDLSGLSDGTITLSVTLTDEAGNTGASATNTVSKDATTPTFVSVDDNGGDNSYKSGESLTIVANLGETGLTVNSDLSVINSGLGSSVAFTDNADGTYSTTIGDVDNGGTMIEGTNIAVTLTATDGVGNQQTDNSLLLTLDKTAPSGYTASIDQTEINANNQNALSFTFTSAEVGSTYDYTISSSGGGTNLTGSGAITTATEQITGIDVSGLGDGTLTLSVTLTDETGNSGPAASTTVQKDTVAPSGYSTTIDLIGESNINTVNQSIIEFSGAGLEAGTTLNYSFTSDNGGTSVTGTETVTTNTEQFDNGGTGYDLSGLNDGNITLTISLTDVAGNTGPDATDAENKDANPPSGYLVAWDNTFINASTASTATFTVSNAEIGSTINNSISSAGDGNTATVSNPITVTSNTQVVSIDVSALTDGVLTVEVSLTDGGGNTGGTVNDNSATLDQTIPSGYTVSVDQASINGANQSAASFTFAGAEVGTTYNYTFSSDGGGNNVTGTGSIATANQQITGIDVSGLADGTLTLSATLTDQAGNTGASATNTVLKDSTAPTFISVDDNGGDNSYRSGETLIIAADLAETGLNLTADLSAINSGLSTTAPMVDNGDGTYSVTVADVDATGNMIEGANIAVALTATDGLGNLTTDNSLLLTLDKTAPTGYTVSIDQAEIDNSNLTAFSFTFSSAEVGTTYAYTISSAGGGTNVTGSGSIATANDQITDIDVSGLNDGLLSLSVTLTDVAGNIGEPATNSVTKNAAIVRFTSTESNADESQSSASIQLELTTLSAADITVDYSVSGSATGSGTDYTLADGSLTIIAGSTNATITISDIVDDNSVEGDETIILTLSNPQNASLGESSVHTYTINDNDQLQPQSITFASIEDQRLGNDPVMLQATGGDSGLPVTFAISTQPTTGVASLSNNQVIVEGVGTVTVTASQAGNGQYEAAEDVSVSFEILANELLLPTLFSPNNDRINDRFILRGGGEVQNFKFSIYDRDGNLVFSTNSFEEISQEGWDGRNNGRNQPQGTYLWVVQGSLVTGAPLQINGAKSGIIRLAR